MDLAMEMIKRPRLDENDVDNNKKSRVSAVSGESILLKQLFPSLITGLIIGKGGEAITKLQADTNTNIKMSKNGEFFPGTSDRVCIIVGRVEDVKEAHFAIWDKIKKKQEISGDESKMNTQYRIVVPNVTVGMIIGKGGCYVKQIKDDTGAIVQVSPKSTNSLLIERIVTISGTCEQVSNAFDMVFVKICEDPQSGSCANMNYNDFGAAGNLPGSDLGLMSPGMMGLGSASGIPSMPANSFAINPFSSFNFGEAIRKMNPVNVENLKTTLRASGCSAQGVEEITASLLVLGHYNLLNNLQATQPGTVSLEYLANVLNGMSSVAAAAITSQTSAAVVSPYGSFIATGVKHDQDKQDQQHMMGFYGALSSGTSATNGSTGFEVLSDLSDGGKELQINENLIGAVLGQGGRNIVEIQKFTSTNISISKKGVFAPGTKNRLVTIKGNNPSDIDKAVFMVQQYVLQEENKRSRSDPHLSLGKF